MKVRVVKHRNFHLCPNLFAKMQFFIRLRTFAWNSYQKGSVNVYDTRKERKLLLQVTLERILSVQINDQNKHYFLY